MKIFISGGNGFLGNALKKKLVKMGVFFESPSSVECNLFFEKSLNDYSNKKYDIIFHLAAWTQAGDFCLRHPGEQWIKNQKINTNMLDWWANEQSQAKLVFMGTSCAYSPQQTLEEENYLEGSPIESLYTYAMTKRMLLQGASAISKQFSLKWLCLVPSTLYGENYHTDGRQMHFIFDLIRKIIRGKEFGEKVVLWGDGYQKRELVHVNDFVDRLLFLTDKMSNQIINIGSGEEKSIREFAKVICKSVGYDDEKIYYDKNKYVGSDSKLLDIKKLLSLYPNHLQESKQLKDGINAVVRWFYETKAYEN